MKSFKILTFVLVASTILFACTKAKKINNPEPTCSQTAVITNQQNCPGWVLLLKNNTVVIPNNLKTFIPNPFNGQKITLDYTINNPLVRPMDLCHHPDFVDLHCVNGQSKPTCNKKGILINKQLDGCGWLISSNNKLYNPTNLDQFAIQLVDSTAITFDYKLAPSQASFCMAEDSIINLTCIK